MELQNELYIPQEALLDAADIAAHKRWMQSLFIAA